MAVCDPIYLLGRVGPGGRPGRGLLRWYASTAASGNTQSRPNFLPGNLPSRKSRRSWVSLYFVRAAASATVTQSLYARTLRAQSGAIPHFVLSRVGTAL